MQRLQLDYQRRTQAPGYLGAGLLVFGLLAALACAVAGYQTWAETVQQREALARDGGGSGSPNARSAAAQQRLAPEIRRAGAVLEELALPWSVLFSAIESASERQREQIALLAVQPEPQAARVRITGEARSLQAILDYLRVLAADEHLARVYLLEHRIDVRDRDRPVRFVLVAEWIRE